MRHATLQASGSEVLPLIVITQATQERIHALAGKYEASEEIEPAMREIFMLEQEAERVDNAYTSHIFSFTESAAEHYRVSVEESAAKHRIENILMKKGMQKTEACRAAQALTRQMVALAWDKSSRS